MLSAESANEALCSLEQEYRIAKESADVVVCQLHRSQEELEYYFLLSREQSEILNVFASQQKRVYAVWSVLQGKNLLPDKL